MKMSAMLRVFLTTCLVVFVVLAQASPDVRVVGLFSGRAVVVIDGQQRISTVRGSAYRLSPQARVTPLSQAIPSIPYESVAAFLSSGVVLEKSQADALPYLLETRGDHLIASAGNEVYVRGNSNDVVASRMRAVRAAKAESATRGDGVAPGWKWCSGSHAECSPSRSARSTNDKVRSQPAGFAPADTARPSCKPLKVLPCATRRLPSRRA